MSTSSSLKLFLFQDFLNILSKVSRGSVDEKLQWVFNLYDLNGDGLITKNEMVDVVQSIYEMLGRATQPAVDDTSAKDHVEKIFNVSIFNFFFSGVKRFVLFEISR